MPSNNNIFRNKNGNKIVPSNIKKSVHNPELVHQNHANRKYITKDQINNITRNKYQSNGLGITFKDIMVSFKVSKRKAQRTLKHFHMKNVLFTAKDLKEQGISFKGFKSSNPQVYYLTKMKSKIIEDKRNVQIDTTGLNPINHHHHHHHHHHYHHQLMPSNHHASSPPSPFSVTPPSPLSSRSFLSPIDLQKIQHLQDILSQLSTVYLYIHKLQIRTNINKEYYNDIDITPDPVNGSKICEQRISQGQGQPDLKFIISPNGTVMVYVLCSQHPFILHEDQDVSDILIFLGRVSDRLHNLFSDTRNRVVPPVKKWVLKGCDVNKDIQIDDMAQLTLPDIQISLAEKALRGYIKQINDKAFYRVEESLTPNESISTAFETLRNNVKIDKDSLSL